MGFSAENTALWNPMVQLGILAAILLAANLLQRKVLFIRRSLLPIAVLAGFLALLVKATGLVHIDADFMESVTYHTIAIGFIALGLRVPKRSELGASKRDGVKSGALIVSTYLLQGLVGLMITVVLGNTLLPGLFQASGILLPLGYGQGPGQANNIGTMYEQSYGFAGGSSFGLAVATMGFLWACIGGVIYMNILVRRRGMRLARDEEKKDAVTVGHFQDEGEIPMSESVDRLTIQFALVLFLYLLTYLLSYGLTAGMERIPALASAAGTVGPLIWGFNFVIGSLLALAARNVLFALKKRNVMSRQYVNNYLLNRISGLVFDVMIAAGICTIEIEDLKGLWVPFLLISTAGGFATLFYLKWICRRLYPHYYYEGFFSMYGMLTGTVSTGILLLREVDPNFESPATVNLVSGTGYAILFGIPMLILVGIAPQSQTLLLATVGLIAVYGAILLGFLLAGKNQRPD